MNKNRPICFVGCVSGTGYLMGKWKTSTAFNPNDAPKLMLAIQKAYEFINQVQLENEGCAEQYEADRMINQMACFHT
jgi:hypothetical protein